MTSTLPRSVVLVHRYFRPDTPPYAEMLAEIAAALAADGFDVQVLTSQPSYGDSRLHASAPSDEVVDGVRIQRLRLLPERKDQTIRRGVNLVLFATQVWWRVLRGPRPDAVMAATTPPVLVAMATKAAANRRRAAFVYHNQDVYPEVLGEQSGRLRSLLIGLVRKLDSRTGSGAERVVVLSSDMVQAWQQRGLPASSLAVINNFDVPQHQSGESSVNAAPAGVRRIVFVGNVGKFQDVAGLVAAVEALPTSGVELVVVGDGAGMDLARAAAGSRTQFIGRVPAAEAAEWTASADLAVVSLTPGLIRYVYPSKTFGYLAAGVPVLVRVDQSSELAETIAQAGVGWAVDPSDASAFGAALESFLATPQLELDEMGRRARELSVEHELSVVTSHWVSLFNEVTQP